MKTRRRLALTTALLITYLFSLTTAVSAAAPQAVPEQPVQTGTPTLTSDQADYTAGSIVKLTGTNWAPNESVLIEVNDSAGQQWSYSTSATADGSGTFSVSVQLPLDFIAQYTATAIGSVSGTVSTTFTDAAGANLD